MWSCECKVEPDLKFLFFKINADPELDSNYEKDFDCLNEAFEISNN